MRAVLGLILTFIFLIASTALMFADVKACTACMFPLALQETITSTKLYKYADVDYLSIDVTIDSGDFDVFVFLESNPHYGEVEGNLNAFSWLQAYADYKSMNSYETPEHLDVDVDCEDVKIVVYEYYEGSATVTIDIDQCSSGGGETPPLDCSWWCSSDCNLGPLCGFVCQLCSMAAAVTAAFQAVTDAFNALVASIQSFFASIGNAINSGINAVVSFFQSLGEGIYSFFLGVGEALGKGAASVLAFFQGIWQGIVDAFNSLGVSLGSLGEDIKETLPWIMVVGGIFLLIFFGGIGKLVGIVLIVTAFIINPSFLGNLQNFFATMTSGISGLVPWALITIGALIALVALLRR